MGFERREILLIVGTLFIAIGTIAILKRTDIAVVIAVVVYFGIRSFVKWRKRQIKKGLGEGICAVCGTRIVDGKCPNCDAVKVG